MADTDLNALFKQAVDGYGQDFLDAEKALYAQGDAAKSLLRTQQDDQKQSAFARFVAKTLADGIEGTHDLYGKAMTAIQADEKRLSRTPLGNPTADTVAGTIAAYSPKLCDMVALHLIKELRWAFWMQNAAVIYLGYYADASVLPAFDQLKADIKSGKRNPTGINLETDSGPFFTRLEETMDLVRVVIESDKT